MSLDHTTRQRIDGLISSHDVTLFMKGDREAPQCGFSASIVRILDGLIAEYQTIDVLADPEIREGVKEYSSWPTVPQLYVKGEFVGGCDIIQELFASGELQSTLGVEIAEPVEPVLTLSERAAEALRQARQEAGEGRGELHLSIDARFQGSIFLAPRQEGEIAVESQGVTLLVDPASASRAEGVSVDVIDAPQGRSFQIDIPKAAQAKA